MFPNFKMRTFAFVPKLRKLVWDLENFRLSHVIRDFPVLPALMVKLFWMHVLGWRQWHLVWTLRSLFSLFLLKACKLWKGKIRCRKCDFVVTANPRYLLLAMVWASTLNFFIPSVFLPYSCQKSCLPFWCDWRSVLQSYVAPFLV